MKEKPVALFDMDGTLCDYTGAMNKELKNLMSAGETFIDPFTLKPNAKLQYLWNRMDLIKADESWWANLPKFQLGFDVMKMVIKLGYSYELLTQSPKDNPAALAGKLRWILKVFNGKIDYTMTRDKSKHYGRVFVDDFPGYIVPWLEHRTKGLVIMPASEYNKDFKHPRVIRYTGKNKKEVFNALKEAMNN